MRKTSENEKAISEGGQSTSNKSAYSEIRMEKISSGRKMDGERKSRKRGFNIVKLRKQLSLSCFTPTDVAGRMGEQQEMNKYELDGLETKRKRDNERQGRGQPKSKTQIDSNAIWLKNMILMEFVGKI